MLLIFFVFLLVFKMCELGEMLGEEGGGWLCKHCTLIVWATDTHSSALQDWTCR